MFHIQPVRPFARSPLPPILPGCLIWRRNHPELLQQAQGIRVGPAFHSVFFIGCMTATLHLISSCRRPMREVEYPRSVRRGPRLPPLSLHPSPPPPAYPHPHILPPP